MPEPYRILVVDDEPDTVDLLTLTLNPAGYQIEHAFSGQEALERFHQDAYDLILLDIMMPDVSGFDVFQTLQSEQKNPPPVIFLTAKDRPEDIEKGEALGAASYLVKPATRGSLLDAIHAALYESES